MTVMSQAVSLSCLQLYVWKGGGSFPAQEVMGVTYLQFHDVPAGWSANQASPNVLGVLVQRANVSRVLIVIYHLERKGQRSGRSGLISLTDDKGSAVCWRAEVQSPTSPPVA